MKLVSVIIPAYNRETTIKRAILSVLNQTYKELEVIVVDDCSSDKTEAVVNSITDQRLVYYKLRYNSGACVARNTGVKIAKGELIAFQDSDDFWYPEKLEKQIKYLESNSYEFISCSFFRKTDTESVVIGNCICPTDRVSLWCKLINKNWVSTQTILCYKYCFDKISFDPLVKRFQDWDLALQAVCYYRLGSLNEPLVDVYLQSNSITNTVKSSESKMYIVEKHRRDVDFNNPVMASVYFKCLGDSKRKANPKEASIEYKKSLKNKFSTKVFLDYIMCVTGIIKIYKTRI